MATPATPTALDESKARAAIDAVKDRKREPIYQAEFTRRGFASKLRRKLSKDLQPLLTGVDLAKIDKTVKATQGELRETLAREKQATAHQLAQFAKL